MARVHPRDCEPRCIPIVATQSISSALLRAAGRKKIWRTVLQSFRTKIFLTQADGFLAKTASELCGKEAHWKVNYNISEEKPVLDSRLPDGSRVAAVSYRAV